MRPAVGGSGNRTRRARRLAGPSAAASASLATRLSSDLAWRARLAVWWRIESARVDRRRISACWRSTWRASWASSRSAGGQVLAVGALVLGHAHSRGRPLEVQDPGDGLVEQVEVVADDQQRAPVATQEAQQPGLGVGVEVVGGLVQQEHVAAREQDAGQLDPAAFATAERRPGPGPGRPEPGPGPGPGGGPHLRRRSRRPGGIAPRPGCSARWPGRWPAPRRPGAASRAGPRPRRARGPTGRGPGPCRARRPGRGGGPGTGSRGHR